MNNSSAVSMPSDLKEENRKAVLYSFQDTEPLTANDIAGRTGISRQTVKKCIEYYVRNQLLCSWGKGTSSTVGGKRPELYTLNDKVRFLCVLLHHHEIVLSLTDVGYNQLNNWSSDTVDISSMDVMWNIISEGMKTLLATESKDTVIGICMVVPFLTDENNCLIVETPFPNWPKTDYGRSLSEPLSGMFPQAKNIQVITDGIAAGSAIIQENTALRTKGNLITIYSASGIGGALFHDGEMVNGTRKIVGAYGHITVAPEDQEVCGCGSRGCLECMVSRKRLWNRFVNQKDLYQKSLLADIPENKVTFPQLFAASAKGDELCRKESAYYAEMFAIAIRNFVLVADPGTVVFQGDFGKADDVFRKRLYNKLHEFKYIREVDQLLIEYDDKDLIKQEAIGATYILINDYLRHPEHYME